MQYVSPSQPRRTLDDSVRIEHAILAKLNVIADDLIWAFTPLNLQGVHAPSWNAISWGVELVGDYSTEPLSEGVRQNAISALASLHSLVGLDPMAMHLHREDPLTTHKGCPGTNVNKSDFQEWVTARLIEMHGGELNIESYEGEGTTVTVELPFIQDIGKHTQAA